MVVRGCQDVGRHRGRRGAGAGLARSARGLAAGAAARLRAGLLRVRGALAEQGGQGTTEYAILVGVLVVIAIVAVIAFRGRIQELWDSIASSINGL